MLDAITAGQRDPGALAQLARGTMRGKIARLEQALDCSFFTAEHAAVLAMMLAAIDHYSTQIQALTEKIEALIAPYLHQARQPGAVPGIGPVCAQDIIAETGVDMTVFPTATRPLSASSPTGSSASCTAASKPARSATSTPPGATTSSQRLDIPEHGMSAAFMLVLGLGTADLRRPTT